MTRDLTYHISGADTGIKIEEYLNQLGCSHSSCTHTFKAHRARDCTQWCMGLRQPAAVRRRSPTAAHHRRSLLGTDRSGAGFLLRIVYEDADLMVIDKPADMPIHPSVNNHNNTLANAVMYYFSEQNLPFCLPARRTGLTGIGAVCLSFSPKICSVPPSSIRCLPAEKSTGIIWQSSRGETPPFER